MDSCEALKLRHRLGILELASSTVCREAPIYSGTLRALQHRFSCLWVFQSSADTSVDKALKQKVYVDASTLLCRNLCNLT